jgi:hypothetical protein
MEENQSVCGHKSKDRRRIRTPAYTSSDHACYASDSDVDRRVKTQLDRPHRSRRPAVDSSDSDECYAVSPHQSDVETYHHKRRTKLHKVGYKTMQYFFGVQEACQSSHWAFFCGGVKNVKTYSMDFIIVPLHLQFRY